MSEFPVVTKGCWSRRTIIIGSVLFLLIVLPADSQIPTASQTPVRRPAPEIFNQYRPQRPRRDYTASPNISPRPPIADTTVSPVEKPTRPVPGIFNQYGPQPPRRDYTASPSISARPPIAGTTVGPAKKPTPDLSRQVRVQLTSDKPQARVGELVTFTISTVPDVPNLDYEFNAGDGSPNIHGNTRTIQHTYRKARSYTAQVTLRGAKSPSRAKLVIFARRPVPPKVPWIYVILGALVIVAVGIYYARNRNRRPAIPAQPPPIPVLPTFHPHWDRGSLQKQQGHVTINYELHFDPNLSYGQERLDADEASLILRKREQ